MRGAGPEVSGSNSSESGGFQSDDLQRSGRVCSVAVAGQQVVDQVVDVIAQLKESDPMLAVDVVLSSRTAIGSFRKAVGRKAFLANVRFQTLGSLVADLAAPQLGERVKLKPDMVRELGRLVAGSADGPLAGQNPAALAKALDSAFANLRDRSVGEIDAIRNSSAAAGEIVRLYETYRLLAEPFYDRVDEMELAISAIDAGSQTSPVLAVLCEPCTSHERDVLQALDVAGRYSVIAMLSGNADCDSDLLSTLPSPAPRLVGPSEAFVVADGDTATRTEGNTVVSLAPDPDCEVQLALMAVADAAKKGRKFGEMGVVFPAENPYRELVHRYAAELGIPVSGKNAKRLSQTAIARFVSTFFEMVETDASLQSVISWLHSAPLRQGTRGARVPAPEWVQLARQAGVCAGDDWTQRVGLLDDAPHVAQMASFMAELIPRVRQDHNTWSHWTAQLLAVINEYFDQAALTATAPTVEAGALQEVIAILSRLSTLDVIKAPVDRNTFFNAARDEFQVPLRGGEVAGGLYVGTLGDCSGSLFSFLAVCGLTESAFPGSSGLTGFASLLRVPDEPTRAEATERRFWLQVTTAQELLLTSPLADTRSRKSVQPAGQLLDVASRIAGHHVTAEDFSSSGHWWMQSVSSYADLVFGKLAPFTQRTKSLHAIAQGGSAPLGAVAFTQARIRDDLTSRDGVVSARDSLELSNRKMSASRFETWATCPFKYFLTYVLNLKEVPDEDDVFVFDPKERGILVHRILERFLGSVEPKQPSQPWSDEEIALLQSIAREELAAAAERGHLPPGLLGEVEQSFAESVLKALLEKDQQLRKHFDVVAGGGGAEVSFGEPGVSEFAVMRNNRTPVHFRGRIDRVDYSQDGTRAVAYDYKTGAATKTSGVKKDPVGDGAIMQVALYTEFLAQQMRGAGVDDPEVAGAYWHVWNERSVVNELNQENVSSRLRDVVTVIGDGIEDGLFPLVPGQDRENCRHCAFKPLCPQDREGLVQRKAGSPAYERFAALKQAEEVGK